MGRCVFLYQCSAEIQMHFINKFKNAPIKDLKESTRSNDSKLQDPSRTYSN